MDDAIFQRFCGPQALPVVVQEKVDGANLGFSIDGDWNIRAQNRSHYVNAQTHVQFANLGSF